MVALRVNVLVLLASSLSVVPQAAYLRSHAATGATSFAKEELSASGKASGSDQSTAAEFEDPADDARAEAGADVDSAFGADAVEDQDYSEVPDEKASSATPVDEASANGRVFNLETGGFEKAAVLLQTGDVDDDDEQEQASDGNEDEASDDGEDQSSEDSEDREDSEDSEDQASDENEDETSDDSEQQASDDGEESGDDSGEDDASFDAEEDSDLSSESLIQTSGIVDDDDQDANSLESDENDSAGVEDDSEADGAALLQKTNTASDDNDDDGSDMDADTRMGDDDAKAAEAEAVKEAGGEEDEEKRAEREEAEQEEIESMNAESAYNFDGIS